MNFGFWLRKLRKERGYSQSKLGTLAEVSSQYISDMETGKRNCPTGPVLARLAVALGVPVDHLLMPEKPTVEASSVTIGQESQERTPEYEALDPAEKEEVDELTRQFEKLTSKLLYERKHGRPPE